MSVKHPIIAVTGSSGAGTTTVMQSFAHIFRREGIKAQVIEGDSFHRYSRVEMRERVQAAERGSGPPLSHFGPEGNLLDPRPESCHQIGIKYPVIDNSHSRNSASSGIARSCRSFRRSSSAASFASRSTSYSRAIQASAS